MEAERLGRRSKKEASEERFGVEAIVCDGSVLYRALCVMLSV